MRRLLPVIRVEGRPYAVVGEVTIRDGEQIVRALDLADFVPFDADEVGVDMQTIENAWINMYTAADVICAPRRRERVAPVVLRIAITASLVD